MDPDGFLTVEGRAGRGDQPRRREGRARRGRGGAARAPRRRRGGRLRRAPPHASERTSPPRSCRRPGAEPSAGRAPRPSHRPRWPGSRCRGGSSSSPSCPGARRASRCGPGCLARPRPDRAGGPDDATAAEADLLERRLGAALGRGARRRRRRDPSRTSSISAATRSRPWRCWPRSRRSCDVALELDDLIEAPTPRAPGPAHPQGRSRRDRDPRRDGRSAVGVNTSGALTPAVRRSRAAGLRAAGRSCWGASSARSSPCYGLQPPGNGLAGRRRPDPARDGRAPRRADAGDPAAGALPTAGEQLRRAGRLRDGAAARARRRGRRVPGMVDTRPAAFARRWADLAGAPAATRRCAAEAEDAGGDRRRRQRGPPAIHTAARRSYAISDRVDCGDHPLRLRLGGRARRGRAAPSMGGRDGRRAAGGRGPGPSRRGSTTSPSSRRCGTPCARACRGRGAGRARPGDGLRPHLRPRADDRRERPSSTPRGSCYPGRARGDERAGQPRPCRAGARCCCEAGRATPSAARRARPWSRSSTAASPATRPAGRRREGLARRLGSPGLRHAGFRLWLKPAGERASPTPRVFALAPRRAGVGAAGPLRPARSRPRAAPASPRRARASRSSGAPSPSAR